MQKETKTGNKTKKIKENTTLIKKGEAKKEGKKSIIKIIIFFFFWFCKISSAFSDLSHREREMTRINLSNMRHVY